jgi:hypothetical protein
MLWIKGWLDEIVCQVSGVDYVIIRTSGRAADLKVKSEGHSPPD